MVKIKTFTSFEKRQIAFQEVTNIVSPKITAGFASFIKGMSDWVLQHDKGISNIVSIPSDPYLGLVLPTVKDVLYAAASRGGFAEITVAIESVMSSYNLPVNKLSQAVRTLSGGESCLLALAKSALLASEKRHLVMCNPESWLSRENKSLIMITAQSYTNCGGGSTIFGMAGDMICSEDGCDPSEPRESLESLSQFKGPEVHISLDDLCVKLSDPTGLSQIKPLSINYSGHLSMQSPIIWEAPNGFGKSVLAGLLSGALISDSGKYGIHTKGYTGKARVLMQDCVYQLFGFTPIDYLLWAFREAPEMATNAVDEYHFIENSIADVFAESGHRYSVGDRENPESLLQVKIALVAARIVQNPVLLILDEPGFALTKKSAQAFVESVAKRCAEQSIGLLIISHLADRYKHIVASEIQCQMYQHDPEAGPERRIIMESADIYGGTCGDN